MQETQSGVTPPWERDSGTAPAGESIPPPPSVPASSESSVPSPDADVLVRTMRSDIASLGLTGGNRPQAQAVRVRLGPEGGGMGAGSRLPALLLKVLIGAVALAALLAALYYFLLPRFWTGRTAETSRPSVSLSDGGEAPVPDAPTGGAAPPPAPQTPSRLPLQLEAPIPAGRFTHQSFFRKGADRTLALTVGASVKTAADLQTYAQKLTQLLAPVSKTPSLVEVELKKPDGAAASFGEFMYEIKTAFFAQWFVAENFSPDVTFFTYKDAKGLWPGFVLQLKPGKNWLFLTAEIIQIEESPGLETLFAVQPGARAPAGFTDETLGEVQARALSYTGNPSARFTYGWFQNYFVVATSRDAFLEALKRL